MQNDAADMFTGADYPHFKQSLVDPTDDSDGECAPDEGFKGADIIGWCGTRCVSFIGIIFGPK